MIMLGEGGPEVVVGDGRGGVAGWWEGSSVDPGSGWGVGSSRSGGHWPERGRQSRTGRGNWWRGALCCGVVGLLRAGG